MDIFTSNNGQNNGKWKSAKFDQLIAAAKGKDANDPAKRWNDLQQAQLTLLKDQGIAPVYQQAVPFLVNSKVKGLVVNTAGVTNNFKNAYIAK